MQALDHPLHTAMGKNGPPQMNLPGRSGRPITEEYIDKYGVEAYAGFERDVFIEIFGMDDYMQSTASSSRSARGAPGSPATST